jgi:molybdate transport system substrate-binding protein
VTAAGHPPVGPRRRFSSGALWVGVAFLMTMPLGDPDSARAEGNALRLYAAGSRRGALTEVAHAFTAMSGIPVVLEFGTSGLLRERLEGGEPGDVFASANMEHPETLARAGIAGPVVLFARNRLCALARVELRLTEGTVLDRMLDPAVVLATSTPRADPAGDYAWDVFRRAEAIQSGSQARLEAKARQLVGGPTSPLPPSDRSVYGQLLAERQADLFLTYCTSAAQAARDVPGLAVVSLPPALAVGADYGLTILMGAPPDRAERLVSFILSPAGQAILARHGFAGPAGPGG